MKKIGIRTHGFIDYMAGLLLIITPGVLNFTQHAELWIVVATGLFILTYSLLTDYQFGVFKIISTSTHLLLDMLTGMLLAISPWLFGFAGSTSAFHLISGIVIVFISMLTNPRPVYHLAKYRRRKLHKPLYRTFSIR